MQSQKLGLPHQTFVHQNLFAIQLLVKQQDLIIHAVYLGFQTADLGFNLARLHMIGRLLPSQQLAPYLEFCNLVGNELRVTLVGRHDRRHLDFKGFIATLLRQQPVSGHHIALVLAVDRQIVRRCQCLVKNHEKLTVLDDIALLHIEMAYNSAFQMLHHAQASVRTDLAGGDGGRRQLRETRPNSRAEETNRDDQRTHDPVLPDRATEGRRRVILLFHH